MLLILYPVGPYFRILIHSTQEKYLPALMRYFFRFRDSHDSVQTLLLVLLHINLFFDGNGRVSRMVMACYLINNGYPPMPYAYPRHPSYPELGDIRIFHYIQDFLLSSHDIASTKAPILQLANPAPSRLLLIHFPAY